MKCDWTVMCRATRYVTQFRDNVQISPCVASWPPCRAWKSVFFPSSFFLPSFRYATLIQSELALGCVIATTQFPASYSHCTLYCTLLLQAGGLCCVLYCVLYVRVCTLPKVLSRLSLSRYIFGTRYRHGPLSTVAFRAGLLRTVQQSCRPRLGMVCLCAWGLRLIPTADVREGDRKYGSRRRREA